MTPLILCSLTLIVTLAVSGYAKVKDPTSTVTALVNLKADSFIPLKLAARTLPWLELGLAAGLLILPGLAQLLTALASLALFSAYWALIARALVQGNTASCNCFGSASQAPTSIFTLIRNTGLLLAAAGSLIGALETRASALSQLLALDAQGWLWLLAAGFACLTLWAIYRAELVESPTQQLEAAQQAGSQPAADQDQAEQDYIRLPIPYADIQLPLSKLPFPDHAPIQLTLRDLAASQARVLLWVSPGCGHCHDVAGKIPSWQQALPMLGIHPVVSDDDSIAPFSFPPEVEVLVDPGYKTQRLFGSGTPAALALGADGLIAGGPVFGSSKVMEFMDDIIDQMSQDPEPQPEAEADPLEIQAQDPLPQPKI